MVLTEILKLIKTPKWWLTIIIINNLRKMKTNRSKWEPPCKSTAKMKDKQLSPQHSKTENKMKDRKYQNK